MNTLILNAAEGRIQLVLAHDGDLLFAQQWSAPSKGTELLTPVLSDALRRLGLAPSHISRIACVVGPGSFTGLRLVLSTAAAFRRATGATVAPLNALQALAASLSFGELFPGRDSLRVRVISHARRGLVHGQDFLVGPAALPEPQGEPAMWELAAACGGLRPDVVLGSGVARNLDVLQKGFASPPLFLPAVVHPSAEALLALTRDLPEDAWVRRDLDPLYLRPCDAVDNLPTIAAKRGQAPEEALAELGRLLSPAAEDVVKGNV